MAIALVGTATVAEAATGTTVTVPVPAAAAPGHLLVAAVAYKTSTAMTAPSGWTLIGSRGSSTAGVGVFYRWYNNEPASYTFTAPITDSVSGEMIALSGVDTTTPLDVAAFTEAFASSGSAAVGPITPVTANTLLLYTVVSQTTATAVTVDAALTKIADTTGTGRRLQMATEVKATASVSTERTFSTATSLSRASVLAAFRPASTPATSAPTVSAGADATATTNTAFTRTATENDGGSAITSRAWTIVSGPTGAGSTIGTAAALSWTPTTAGTYTLRYSATNSVGTGTDDVVVTVNVPTPVTPVLVRSVVGIPTGDTAIVKARVTNATSVRLKVGTNTAVTTGVIYGPAVTPDANGIVDLSVSGLTHPTRYYARVAMTDSGGTEVLDAFTSPLTLRAQPTGNYSFAFDFASCTDATDSAAMAAVAARDDDFFLHVGDLYYADGSGNTLANISSKIAAKVDAPNHLAVMRSRPFVYTPSDHDAAANNSNAGVDATAWANWNTAFRQNFPAPGIPASNGVYYTFVWGRVRFIVLDTRSFATIPSATDNSSKTRLGAVQKQWVKDVISAATEPVICIVNADPWIGTPVVGDDAWLGYTVERTEMANFFAASGRNIFMTAGDMHAVAADDGTNSPGGVALFHAAPLNNSASQKGGTYTVGPIPATGTAVVQQYGRCVVTDSGNTITVGFTGYNSSNTQLLSLTKTYTLPAVTANVTITGTGALAVTSSMTTAQQATLSGSGALTASTSTSAVRAATLSGSGALSAASTASLTASGALGGTGALTAAASPSLTRTAALAGAGSLTAGPVERLTPTHRATVTTLTSPTVSSWLSGNVALAAGSTVIYSGTVYNGSDVALSARVGVDWKDSAGSWIGGTGNSATIPAGGTQTITGRGVAIPGTTQFTVTFGFTSTASGQSVTFSDFSVKQDDPPISLTIPVALTGSGALAASSSVSVSTVAALTGSGVLAASTSAATANTVSAALTGTGTLTASTTYTETVNAALTGSGSLSVVAAPALTRAVTLSGTGALVAASALNVIRAVSLSGVGTLDASGTPSLTRSGVLTGTGTLTGIRQVLSELLALRGDNTWTAVLVLVNDEWSDVKITTT